MTALQIDQLIAVVALGLVWLVALAAAWDAALDRDWSMLVLCALAIALASAVIVSVL